MPLRVRISPKQDLLTQKARRMRNRRFLIGYKNGQRCANCPENDIRCLDFHHVDPSNKKYNIGHDSNLSLVTMVKEIEKCILLCANCHRKEEYWKHKFGRYVVTYDADDLSALMLVIWREARGEGQDGMRAVAHVIKNRVLSAGFPKTIHGVIFQKNAFTSMTVLGDPEFNLQPEANDPQYTFCKVIAPEVLSGSDEDNTYGAVYYADEKKVTSGWYKKEIIDSGNYPITAVIGRQIFRKGLVTCANDSENS